MCAVEAEWKPQVPFASQRKIFAKDSDDGVGLAVELNSLAQNLRLTAKLALPQRETEKRLVIASRGILIGRESPAESRLNTEEREETGSSGRSGNLYRRSFAAGQIRTAAEGVRTQL